MVAVADRLSLAEFQLKYSNSDTAYEYWYGAAIPKAMPTWIHAFLQGLIVHFLIEAGYKAGPEVDLRIDPNAISRPDIIATRGKLEHPYPTRAVELVVEILSSGDSMSYVLEKCMAYQRWGFELVYIVDPDNRKVYRWTGQALETTADLTSVPVDKIWTALHDALQ
jgi:Uma2 family endonuclease